MAQILMCRPDFYGIEYEINPWMNRERQADHGIAIQQWNSLRDILVELGVEVCELTPIKGLPDLVFTANAAVVYRHTAFLSRFRHEQRRGEEPHDADWLAGRGLNVHQLPSEMFFEGAGDALFCGDTLFAGYRVRSDVFSQQYVAQEIGCRVIPLELVNSHYYHLDTCFCPLEPSLAIYYPGAFDDYGQRVLPQMIEELIEVNESEAASFACNAVVVGRTVVTNHGCPQLHEQLRARGFEPIATPLDEFVKAGGSAKCLTLRLDGEEAAAWKSQERPEPSPEGETI